MTQTLTLPARRWIAHPDFVTWVPTRAKALTDAFFADDKNYLLARQPVYSRHFEQARKEYNERWDVQLDTAYEELYNERRYQVDQLRIITPDWAELTQDERDARLAARISGDAWFHEKVRLIASLEAIEQAQAATAA